jgi:hypothetical protein
LASQFLKSENPLFAFSELMNERRMFVVSHEKKRLLKMKNVSFLKMSNFVNLDFLEYSEIYDVNLHHNKGDEIFDFKNNFNRQCWFLYSPHSSQFFTLETSKNGELWCMNKPACLVLGVTRLPIIQGLGTNAPF